MPSVLVGDDEQPLRGWLRHFLEAKGYHVKEAGNGKEALALIDRHQPALMILDMYMRDRVAWKSSCARNRARSR
jgi:CheY-like chemotaxis protein